MKNKKKLIVGAVSLILLAFCVIAGIALIRKYTPTKEMADPAEYFGLENDRQAAVVLNFENLGGGGMVADNIWYLDYEIVKEKLNSRFFWDDSSNLMLYTTPENILEIPAESMSFSDMTGGGSREYMIVRMDGAKVFLAMDFVREFTDMEYSVYTSPNRMVVQSSFEDRQTAQIRKIGKVRTLGGIKSPILREVAKGEEVTILDPMSEWTGIMTSDGYIGYIKNKWLTGKQIRSFPRDFEEPVYTSARRDHRINLVWHQVTSMETNYNLLYDIADMKGVNVLSPTWFSVMSESGELDSYALADYVDTAHKDKYEVWALIDDFTYPVDMKQALSNTESRKKIENQLIASAIETGFDGINVDFETIDDDSADAFLEFMREMSVKCRKNGLVLSVDVPVPMSFNEFFNRKELGTVCDYVIIMGYDEHYDGSEEAGSVASLGFENEGIRQTMESVPAEKILSGIPFYTRLWNTVTDEDGMNSVTSIAYGMAQAQEFLEESGIETVWDDETFQNYAEFYDEEDDSLYQIWMEDLQSLEEKLILVKDYGLGGCACWKLGLETTEVWDLIQKYVN